jgi:hypothetical protein
MLKIAAWQFLSRRRRQAGRLFLDEATKWMLAAREAKILRHIKEELFALIRAEISKGRSR